MASPDCEEGSSSDWEEGGDGVCEEHTCKTRTGELGSDGQGKSGGREVKRAEGRLDRAGLTLTPSSRKDGSEEKRGCEQARPRTLEIGSGLASSEEEKRRK